MSLAVVELKPDEFKDVYGPLVGAFLNDLMTDGRCAVHRPNMPRLRRSHWCHDRRWEAQRRSNPASLEISDRRGAMRELNQLAIRQGAKAATPGW